ncbi:MAG: hypothetical protein CMK27_00635 [Porticoccaceae bacterium]|jgi:hypothetical protein|nr:hypothetical protein [Porticoccaceae bacterium]|tara:strand:- start:508 stop:726 length:219 start_codon:yes stop_codon:yes gene_type:complete
MERRSYIKWNWPILTKIKKVYKEKGLFKTILWILIIFLGLKLVILNGIIFFINTTFGAGLTYAPILRSIFGG